LRIAAILKGNNYINYISHVILIISTIICYVKFSFVFLMGPILFAAVSMLADIFYFMKINIYIENIKKF